MCGASVVSVSSSQFIINLSVDIAWSEVSVNFGRHRAPLPLRTNNLQSLSSMGLSYPDHNIADLSSDGSESKMGFGHHGCVERIGVGKGRVRSEIFFTVDIEKAAGRLVLGGGSNLP